MMILIYIRAKFPHDGCLVLMIYIELIDYYYALGLVVSLIYVVVL